MISRLLIYLPLYFTLISLAAFFWHRPLTLTICYVVISALVLWRYHRPGDLIYYFVPFVIGPLGEMMPVKFGSWSYSEPFFLVPLWLPFVWGLAGLFMRRVQDVLLEVAAA